MGGSEGTRDRPFRGLDDDALGAPYSIFGFCPSNVVIPTRGVAVSPLRAGTLASASLLGPPLRRAHTPVLLPPVGVSN